MLENRIRTKSNSLTHSNPVHLVSRLQSTVQHNVQQKALHIFDPIGKKQTLEHLLKGNEQNIWKRSASNECGRLAQGNKFGIQGTDTIQFIHKTNLPHDAKITYASFVCDIRPLKKETHRVRMVVGGDKLTYHEDTGSPAASLLETKIMLNSVITDAKKGAKLVTCDLKDFFLATPMDTPEFMKIPIKVIPPDIQQQYQIATLQHNESVYIKIQKGMYGLKQAAILAYNKLVAHLEKYGYRPIKHIVGLWEHKTRPTKFCICMDKFVIFLHKDAI